jgi:hypothetical protein
MAEQEGSHDKTDVREGRAGFPARAEERRETTHTQTMTKKRKEVMCRGSEGGWRLFDCSFTMNQKMKISEDSGEFRSPFEGYRSGVKTLMAAAAQINALSVY